MNDHIDAIIFDMGGTLRSTNTPLREVNLEKIHEMLELLNMDHDEVEFIQLLKKRTKDLLAVIKKDFIQHKNL